MIQRQYTYIILPHVLQTPVRKWVATKTTLERPDNAYSAREISLVTKHTMGEKDSVTGLHEQVVELFMNGPIL